MSLKTSSASVLKPRSPVSVDLHPVGLRAGGLAHDPCPSRPTCSKSVGTDEHRVGERAVLRRRGRGGAAVLNGGIGGWPRAAARRRAAPRARASSAIFCLVGRGEPARRAGRRSGPGSSPARELGVERLDDLGSTRRSRAGRTRCRRWVSSASLAPSGAITTTATIQTARTTHLARRPATMDASAFTTRSLSILRLGTIPARIATGAIRWLGEEVQVLRPRGPDPEDGARPGRGGAVDGARGGRDPARPAGLDHALLAVTIIVIGVMYGARGGFLAGLIACAAFVAWAVGHDGYDLSRLRQPPRPAVPRPRRADRLLRARGARRLSRRPGGRPRQDQAGDAPRTARPLLPAGRAGRHRPGDRAWRRWCAGITPPGDRAARQSSSPIAEGDRGDDLGAHPATRCAWRSASAASGSDRASTSASASTCRRRRSIARSWSTRSPRSLSAAGLNPQRLTLEVTESAVMDEPERVAAALAEMQSEDAAIAIDDFGTGHSSLARLEELPLDTLKIDQMFLEARRRGPPPRRCCARSSTSPTGSGSQRARRGSRTRPPGTR